MYKDVYHSTICGGINKSKQNKTPETENKINAYQSGNGWINFGMWIPLNTRQTFKNQNKVN